MKATGECNPSWKEIQLTKPKPLHGKVRGVLLSLCSKVAIAEMVETRIGLSQDHFRLNEQEIGQFLYRK